MTRGLALQQGAPMDWLQRTKPLLITVAAVGLATLVHLPLDAIWSGRFPFMAFFPAILVAAITSGWRYGVLAAALSALAVFARRDDGSDLLIFSSIGIFLAANGVIIWLAETARRARARGGPTASGDGSSRTACRASARKASC